MKIKKTIFIFLFIAINITVYAEDTDNEKNLEEGKLLFRLEKASWIATDDFLARFSIKSNSLGGYLSYKAENDFIYTILFSRYNNNKILARYKFGYIPQKKPLSIDTTNNDAIQIEKELINLRQNAIDIIYNQTDSFFVFYKNTSFNLIPLIKENERIVYVLTGPKNSGEVLIGNDYILSYDNKNNFIKKEKLHNSLITLPWSGKNDTSEIVSTVHTHILSDYITATDICTLLLYKEFVKWKIHYVISPKYVTAFDLEKELFYTVPTKVWEDIYKDMKKKK